MISDHGLGGRAETGIVRVASDLLRAVRPHHRAGRIGMVHNPDAHTHPTEQRVAAVASTRTVELYRSMTGDSLNWHRRRESLGMEGRERIMATTRPLTAPGYPFAEQWLEGPGGGRLHYVDAGPRSEQSLAVVLIHGNPTWSFLWRQVLGALEEEPGDLRLVAPDLPGFGRSLPPEGYSYGPPEHAGWVARLVDALKLERFVVVGHDWGGPIGLSVATQRPERLAGLVLTNTWCWSPDWRMRAFSALMGGRFPGRFLNLELNAFARWVLPAAVHHRDELAAEVWRAYREPFPDRESRRGTWVFPRAIRTWAPWLEAVRDELDALPRRLPVELVWGMRDPAFGHESVLRRWRDLLPAARVTRLTDASHYVPEDRSDAITEAVRRVREVIRG